MLWAKNKFFSQSGQSSPGSLWNRKEKLLIEPCVGSKTAKWENLFCFLFSMTAECSVPGGSACKKLTNRIASTKHTTKNRTSRTRKNTATHHPTVQKCARGALLHHTDAIEHAKATVTAAAAPEAIIEDILRARLQLTYIRYDCALEHEIGRTT